jgi:Fe-S-cluster containining protein
VTEGYDDQEKRLTRRMSGIADKDLAEAKTAAALVGALDTAAKTIDGLIDKATPKFPAARVLACKAGCAFCCHQFEVHASAPEVIRLAAHIEATFDEGRRARLMERLDLLEVERDKIPLPDWSLHRLPCALLEDGRCGVYAARPFVCRSVTSYDARACEDNRDRPGGPASIPASAEIKAIGRAAMAAFAQASDKRPGKGGLLDLARALRIALTIPNAAQRWIDGEKVFDAARSKIAGHPVITDRKGS